LDIPKKLSRDQKKTISSISDILGSNLDNVEERIREEASRRRG